MGRRIFGIFFMALILFSNVSFAENWKEVNSSSKGVMYTDLDGIHSYAQGEDLIIMVRTKIILPEGFQVIALLEYKISPLKRETVGKYQGMLMPPIPQASRTKSYIASDLQGKILEKKNYSSDEPWRPFAANTVPYFLMPWYLEQVEKDAKEHPEYYKKPN